MGLVESTVQSALSTHAALGGRALVSVARQRMTVATSAGGRSATRSPSGTGVPTSLLVMSATELGPSNGSVPLSISYAVVPSA